MSKNINIESIIPFGGYIVYTNDAAYTRLGTSSWMERIGESEESISDQELINDLEKAFQEAIKTQSGSDKILFFQTPRR